MKHTLILITLFLLFVATSCDSDSNNTAWLNEIIKSIEAMPSENQPDHVASYTFQGETVYYVAPKCCDIFSELYNDKGILMCHPDGGITGTGDGKCPTFFEERTHEKIIWRRSEK